MPVYALGRPLLYLNSSFRIKVHGDVMQQLNERGYSSKKNLIKRDAILSPDLRL